MISFPKSPAKKRWLSPSLPFARGKHGSAQPTVSDAADRYLARCRTKVKPSTCSTYEITITRHILPAFGSTPLAALTEEDISGFLREKCFPSQGEPLAPATVRSVVTTLRGILACAAGEGWQTVSPSCVHRPAQSAEEARTLTAEEEHRLKEYCRANMDRTRLGVLLCLFTGLRIGELCAMKWGDLSLDGEVLTVRRTIQRIRNPNYTGKPGETKTIVIFDAPKSKCANRCIPIPARLLPYLRQYQGPADAFLLTGTASAWMEPRTLQNCFKKVLSEAEIDPINFHALRHTFATNCIEQGFDVKALSRILGHSDVSVTLNTYVHPSVSTMRAYMNRLE